MLATARHIVTAQTIRKGQKCQLNAIKCHGVLISEMLLNVKKVFA